MIPALLIVGIAGLTVGVYLGIAGAAIIAARRMQQTADCCARAVASRDMWRRRATKAEQWLPQEVVADILLEEQAS
jgi:MFS superfamily sulfate permease-like transporter